MQKDVIFLFEHTADKYAPKVVKKVRLAHHFVAEAALEAAVRAAGQQGPSSSTC